jgi:hypothetical protein
LITSVAGHHDSSCASRLVAGRCQAVATTSPDCQLSPILPARESDCPGRHKAPIGLAERRDDRRHAFARVGAQTDNGVLWVDVAQPTDWEGLALELDSFTLPGYSRPMLGYVLQRTSPGSVGINGVPSYDRSVEAGLRARAGAAFLYWFDLVEEVGFPGNEPPMVFTRRVTILASDRWVITNRDEGSAHSESVMAVLPPAKRRVLADAITNVPRTRDIASGYDVAMVICRGLADSYPHAVAQVRKRLADGLLDFIHGATRSERGRRRRRRSSASRSVFTTCGQRSPRDWRRTAWTWRRRRTPTARSTLNDARRLYPRPGRRDGAARPDEGRYQRLITVAPPGRTSLSSRPAPTACLSDRRTRPAATTSRCRSPSR